MALKRRARKRGYCEERNKKHKEDIVRNVTRNTRRVGRYYGAMDETGSIAS